MSKPKVLIVLEDLKNYRDPIYQLIAEQVDLTVAYTFSTQIKESTYNIIQFPFIKIGKLIIHKGVRKLYDQFDAVILLPHFKLIWANHVLFTSNKFKTLVWSNGVHISYDREYDLKLSPSFLDKVFEFLQNRANACIFYTRDTIDYWRKYKTIDENKYFVAHNTVKVEKIGTPQDYYDQKDSFLFVGTLYKQKGLDELIEAYAKANESNDNLPILNIVGGGAERILIEELINSLRLSEKVKLVGPIYDEQILSQYFKKAILCLSPKQAGLSVLKSFGYGVPFVTRKNAITGGERNNIKNGYNGCFYNTIDELSFILVDSVENKEKYLKMSINAYEYYNKNATPENMAQGVVDAINYALSK